MNPVYRTNTFYHPAYHSQRQSSPASSSGQHSPHYFSYNASSPPTVSILPHMSTSSSLNTPSSASSLSILTPLSPPLPEFSKYYKDTLLDEDDIEMDESESDDEDIDSDFADEMDGVDDGGAGGVDQNRLLRSTSSWHQESMHSFASISALDGALGHYSRPITTTTTTKSHLRSQDIDDRKMSMSAPGHPRASYPSLDVQVPHAHQQQQQHHQRQQQRPEPNNTYFTVSRSHHPSPYLYPQPDVYTHIPPSSTALFAPPPPHVHTVHHPMQPPSTTANFSTNAVSASASANPYHSRRPAVAALAAPAAVPILQPQPIRPIPPIPLSDLAAASEEEQNQQDRDHTSSRAGVPDLNNSNNSSNNNSNNRLMKSEKSPGLSPLSLLCQPVSDAVRYQLKTMGDLAGNASSEDDDEDDDDEEEEGEEGGVNVNVNLNDTEGALGAYVGIISEDMILPSQTTAYFDTRLTRPNKVKQFQCDCGCMGVCLG